MIEVQVRYCMQVLACSRKVKGRVQRSTNSKVRLGRDEDGTPAPRLYTMFDNNPRRVPVCCCCEDNVCTSQ